MMSRTHTKQTPLDLPSYTTSSKHSDRPNNETHTPVTSPTTVPLTWLLIPPELTIKTSTCPPSLISPYDWPPLGHSPPQPTLSTLAHWRPRPLTTATGTYYGTDSPVQHLNQKNWNSAVTSGQLPTDPQQVKTFPPGAELSSPKTHRKAYSLTTMHFVGQHSSMSSKHMEPLLHTPHPTRRAQPPRSHRDEALPPTRFPPTHP